MFVLPFRIDQRYSMNILTLWILISTTTIYRYYSIRYDRHKKNKQKFSTNADFYQMIICFDI